jgi:CDP-4-dehydro-6-deoxyglucose reductase, E3
MSDAQSILLNTGLTFKSIGSATILDAGEKSSVAMPYSCKTGRCSTCKCKVISGSTFAIHPEIGLTEKEKADGWILSCVRSALTDLEIEVEDLGGKVLPKPKTLPCRISNIEFLSKDVIRVLLRLPPSADFIFIPGQYIDVVGPKGVRRSYSLANSSFKDKILELIIRAVDDGELSQYWFKQAKINDLLRINGPLGTFFLRESSNQNIVFLATGTGIAPVKSILGSLPYLNPESQPKSVTVLWGGRTREDLYIDFTAIHGKYQFIPVLSRANHDWTGARGYVQNTLLESKPDLNQTTVYACGSDSMIKSAKMLLLDAGLPANRFYSDAFVSSGSI